MAPSFISIASRLKNIARAAVVEASEETGRKLARILNIKSYPALFLLTPWGANQVPKEAVGTLLRTKPLALPGQDSELDGGNGAVNVTHGLRSMSAMHWTPPAINDSAWNPLDVRCPSRCTNPPLPVVSLGWTMTWINGVLTRSRSGSSTPSRSGG